MKTIGAFEAKTHLSALLEEVEAGGEVLITRRGKPVARLTGAMAASPARRPIGIWKSDKRLPTDAEWAAADAESLKDFEASLDKPL